MNIKKVLDGLNQRGHFPPSPPPPGGQIGLNHFTCLIVQSGFLFHLRVYLPQITIFISHDQLPSGLVAQLVEQRCLRRSWVQIPLGSEIFFLSPCGPISFLGLSLRRYHLGYLHSTSTYHSSEFFPSFPLRAWAMKTRKEK